MKTLEKSQNGTAKNEAKEVGKAATEHTAMKVVKEGDKPTTRTAAQRIERLEQMRSLADKYDFLKGKEAELRKFMIGSDGTTEKLTLKSSTQMVEINSSAVIKKVVDLVAAELAGILGKTEAELIGFEI